MDAIIEFILIGVTLGAAILGTASDPSKKTKIAIISLAVMTSIATGYQSFSNAKENTINKKLIIALVQSSNQPTYFSHDLVKKLSPLFKEEKKYVSGQTVFEGSGERIFTLNNEHNDELSGVLYISKKAMNPVYYAYAVDGSIDVELKKILSDKWTNCEDHWSQCINELSAISKVAFEIAPIEITGTTATLNSDTMTFQISSIETFRDEVISIKIEREFIESLYNLNPIDRGLKILNKGQLYVVENL